MYCLYCGKEIEDGTTFCPYCGKQQEAEENVENNDWFYVQNDLKCGPLDSNGMRELIEKGQISKETLVWKKGMLDWIPAEKTEWIQEFKNVVPPMPKGIVGSKYAWALATVPILASGILELILLEVDAWGLFVESNAGYLIGGACAMILNFIFIYLDFQELKKYEQKVENWMWMGILLVPAYLFVRASKTDKQYGYAITWCVVFLFYLIIFYI